MSLENYSFSDIKLHENYVDKTTIINSDIYFVQINYNLINGVQTFQIKKAKLIYSTKRFYKYLLEKDLEESGYINFVENDCKDIDRIYNSFLKTLKREKFNRLNVSSWDNFDNINLYGCFDKRVNIKDLDNYIEKIIIHFYKVIDQMTQMKRDLIEIMIKD